MGSRNPFSFRPWQVVFWTTLTYVALLVALVVVQEVVPPLDLTGDLLSGYGANLTEAWFDLATLTQEYHPYNSRANDDVRAWLLLRIGQILARNEAGPDTAVVFNDLESNFTALDSDLRPGGTNTTKKMILYFEGSNVMLYIRGTQDPAGDWWNSGKVRPGQPIGKGGVLVNAHFDSVSTGYGATDNGMGVVTLLQLINLFTMKDNQPARGIVAMFNNGEEDYLHGAKAFGQHPLQPFCHTFLNLEGAGAGGRSLLVRSTDEEVTRAYAKGDFPFGTVIGVDFFKSGLIRSQTDYVVLNGVYGERGLDLVFYKPRARYHTDQDDITHTSRASLQHMLLGAVSSVSYLSSDTGNTFLGPGSGDLSNGQGSDAVWFSIFGKGFVLFNLRAMFAWSLTALIATPLLLIFVSYILHKTDRYYFFTATVSTYEHPDYEPVKIGGFKGFMRYPFALAVAGTMTLGAAFLLAKVNPFIVYNATYTVWAMMFSMFYFVFWVIMRAANFARPSALHRGYANIWLFIISWSILVVVTVSEDRFQMGSGYIFVWFQSAVFVATLITLLELFSLPRIRAWGQESRENHEAQDRLLTASHGEDHFGPGSREIGTPHQEPPAYRGEADEPEEASETTPLVGGRVARGGLGNTFANTYRRSVSTLTDSVRRRDGDGNSPYDDEQKWSGNLATWTWLLQFLIVGPVMIIMVGEIGLTCVESVAQTGVDGTPVILPYLGAAIFSILVLLPVTPFMHRIPHHIPVFLLAVLVCTLIYNLVAFPFSEDNRYKAFFQQTVNLDTRETNVSVSGVEQYVRSIITDLPSAAGRTVNCGSTPVRKDLVTCVWDGSAVAPRLGDSLPDGVPPQEEYASLVAINATRTAPNKARIEVSAVNTKNCVLVFNKPVSHIHVVNASAWDSRFGSFPESGVDGIRLWSRDWDRTWVVETEWKADAASLPAAWDDTAPGLDGYVACQWADAKALDIRALTELLKYAPKWATVTKAADGLVEGRKSFFV